MSGANTRTTTTVATRVEYRSFAASVSRVERCGASFVRVTLTGDELTNFLAAGLDQRVKLVLPIDGSGVSTFPRAESDWYAAWRDLPQNERCPMRTYTVRAFRAESNEIDIDFVVHGDSGPATRWANRASVGDEVLLIGPDARTLVPGNGAVGGVEFRPGEATRILLAGDETAVPAICSIVEHLPADTRGQVFLEVATEADILPLEAPGRMTVSWLARDRRAGIAHGGALGRAVRAWVSEMVVADDGVEVAAEVAPDVDVDAEILWDIPADIPDRSNDLYAWIAGEAGCIKDLRRFLVRDAGLHRDDVAFMGYWRAGRSEN